MEREHLPIVGAAMPIALLPDHLEWLLEGQRPLEIRDPYLPGVLDGDFRALAREARALLGGHTGPRGVHGPFSGLVINSHDRRVREVVADRLRQGLEFAGELGATHMVIHSPYLFLGSPFGPVGSGLEHAHATLGPLLPLARDIGCTLVIENCWDKHPAPLLALIRSFDSEIVRLSIDTGHAYLNHLGGGPTPDLWAREAGGLLFHLHLQDLDAVGDRHWAPGDGVINWYALFRELAALPHPPRLILEITEHADIARGAAWLAERGFAR